MRSLTLLFATAGVAAISSGCTPSARTAEISGRSARPRVVGYLASWGVQSKGTRIADLPARDLTHIFYAFAKIDAAGRVALGDACVDVGECARATGDTSRRVQIDADMMGRAETSAPYRS